MPRLLALALILFAAGAARAAEPPKFTLNPGEHICIVGNTLAERMQHDGHLEAMLHARFPKHDLTIRNLGFSGDEITTRLRSMDFGTPDEWLNAASPVPQPSKLPKPNAASANRFENVATKPDVIFAFFGYNESFAGEKGLPKFEKDLAAYLDHLAGQKYNGKSAPRVVLFSPTAQHDLMTPDLPDGKANNERLKLYTAAMSKVAAAKGVVFVDLFAASAALYATRPFAHLTDGRPVHLQPPFTINGLHMSDAGNKALARIIGDGLIGGTLGVPPHYEATRAAVVAKNRLWFNRYRAVDGYSTYGERAFLKFTAGQTNYEVAQRELEVIDALTLHADKCVWAAAKGEPAPPAPTPGNGLPAFVPVVTNKPGAGPKGEHLFLTAEEAISKMTVGKGLKVSVFADETAFPELAKPVQMQFDVKGRLWVATWPTYPHWKPTEPMNDKLVIIEDTDGDGKADKKTVFADDLHNPTGFEFLPDGGVLVAQAPDIVILRDTNGDSKYDTRERVLHGLDTADTHHSANSFARGPDGSYYFQEGTFHHSQVESPYGPVRRNVNGGVYRYNLRTQRFDVYVTYGFANPHGHAFDAKGRDIVVDGTGAQPYDAALFSGHLEYPDKHARTPQVYQQRTRPCGGIEFLSSSHFPEAFRDNLIVTNVIGFQGLLRYKIEDDGGTLKGTELEPIVSSTDPNFRPVDVKTGPDGALYFVDWQNPIIGHMQHNLRDPSRDKTHGRVYRVTAEGRELVQPVAVAGAKERDLLGLLMAAGGDANVRSRARLELAGRPWDAILAAAKDLGPASTNARADAEQWKLELVWLYAAHNRPDADILNAALASPAMHVRAAAVRVLADWREKLPDALATLRKLAADPAPRVRLEAVRAASFFPQAEAVEVVLIAGEQPGDKAIAHVTAETLRALDPHVKAAVASGREVKFTTPAGARYFLKTVATDDLLKLKRTGPIFSELLTRPGVREEVRTEAVTALAAESKVAAPKLLLDALKGLDATGADESVVYDLMRLVTARPAELQAVRGELEALIQTGKSPVVRQLGYGALVGADGNPDKAWALATKSLAGLKDFVTAVPLIRDPNQRAALYPRVQELLTALPGPLAAQTPKTAGVAGRFVRLELPGKLKTLTLAEVEVMSGGKNVARQGKARQVSTSHGGVAQRALDGNKSGKYTDNGQTHTAENIDNPWWEVDLGSTQPVDRVLVYNRTDTNLNSRLTNFTLTVLDGHRKEVFKKVNNPSPDGVMAVEVGGESPERQIRAAAMLALTTVRGQEPAAFSRLAALLATPERGAALAAIERIPVAAWPRDRAAPLLKQMTEAIAQVPAAERTTPATLAMLQFSDTLAGLLPRDQAKAARKALGELGVRVIRVGTLTDQMLFDKDRLVVQAGKPVEFVFENTDIMPHNFVITAMGKLEEVGNAAEAFGTQPGAQERDFVPPSKEVLLASKLLQPQSSQALRYTAPTKPGVYPYVCTYPGHWRRMYGALYVVADLDEYLADPEGYLAKSPVPVADELLKFNRPRTEWTTAELGPAMQELNQGGRSFAHGKQLFTATTCVSCHKYDGQGQEFGPNLAALDASVFKGPEDVLKHILEPSIRIEDKYRSYTFQLASGGVATGMVLEKTPAGDFKVIENPLLKAEARLIAKGDLDEEPKASPVSIMPKGLLDKLTKDEILDLVAYVTSKADPKHRYYHGAGHHHGATPAKAGHSGHEH